jgi:hypothetical protein
MATTTATTATLAARAAGLLTKQTAYAVAEKAMQQAIDAKRVYPAMAQDFAEQLGYELPLKTRDFVKVVGNLLAASDKPLKGVISKRKSEIIATLSELVGALTDTQPIALPAWAFPKERTKKEEPVDASGALDRANAEALANEQAEVLATKAVEAQSAIDAEVSERALRVTLNEVAEAVATIKNLSDYLSPEQRAILRAVLEEPALV